MLGHGAHSSRWINLIWTGRVPSLPLRSARAGLEKVEPNDLNKTLAPDFRSLQSGDLDRLTELQTQFLDVEANSAAEISILGEADTLFDALI